jgi:hypothetical protein
LQNVLTFFIWDNIWPHHICALTWKCRCHISLLFTGFWWTKQKPSKVCSFRCPKRALFVGTCGVIDILEILNEFLKKNFKTALREKLKEKNLLDKIDRSESSDTFSSSIPKLEIRCVWASKIWLKMSHLESGQMIKKF